MTDGKYDEKLARLDDLSHKCQRANIPRYAGIALFLTGLIGGPIMAKAAGTTAFQITFWGGIAGGTTSYALGYLAFGGRDCNEARDIYRDVDVAADGHNKSVEGSEPAREMQQRAQ